MDDLAFGNMEAARGLGGEERRAMAALMEVFCRNRARNAERTRYYEGKQDVKNIGIAVPPQLAAGLEVSCCWPQKTVEALQSRSAFDGFVASDEGVADRLTAFAQRNDLRARYSRAVIPQLVHGCAFATLARRADGAASVRFRSAQTAAALWDGENDRVAAGFAVVDSRRFNGDRSYLPSLVHLHMPDALWVLSRDDAGGQWRAERMPHAMGRPMMEALVYRASEGRPFGQSRITRPVMSLTDSYMREMLRLEVGAELFTSPQKVILGAGDEAFDMDKYVAYVTNFLVIGRDEDGNAPTLTQLAAASMQPHVDVMRNLAAQFAGATCVPISELGVVHDNPSSAEAIYAAKEALVVEVDASLNAANAESLKAIAQMALAVEGGVPLAALTDEERDFSVKFRNPAMPSLVSQADAMSKVAGTAPWIADTEVFLEEVGFDEGQRRRLLSDKRRAENRAAFNAIFSGAQTAPAQQGGAAPQPAQPAQPAEPQPAGEGE